MRPAAPGRPAHAGGLARWERLAFGAAFAAMAAFVIVIAMSSAGLRGPGPVPPGGGGPPAGASGPAAGQGGAGRAAGAGVRSVHSGPSWDRRLAAALAPVLAQYPGRLAVGVIDRSTGAVAIYGGGRRFRAASIEKASILASVLLPGPAPGLSGANQRLAAAMIEASDNSAAAYLWRLAGGSSGVAAAGRRLGLRHTAPGPAQDWSLTTTTVGDQLTLLQDLTSASSPLTAAARSYELRLMRAAAAGQRWGVSAAASPGTSYAVKDGWRSDGSSGRWVANSIGVVRHGHHRLLLAVLAAGQPSVAAGIAADEAAAAAAAACITSRP
jgi:beta-lactamase class A